MISNHARRELEESENEDSSRISNTPRRILPRLSVNSNRAEAMTFPGAQFGNSMVRGAGIAPQCSEQSSSYIRSIVPELGGPEQSTRLPTMLPRYGGPQQSTGLPSVLPRYGGPQQSIGLPSVLPEANNATFMQRFHASNFNSFPSSMVGYPFGHIPSQAFISRVPTDSIQSESFGNEVAARTSKRARLAYSCPPPLLTAPSRRGRQGHGFTKREVWVPCKMTKPTLYKNGSIDIVMKKVTQFYSLPVEVNLHKDTPWGGVYNGDGFLPGSAQLQIAEQCSVMDPRNSAWASIPGCFFTKTSFSQLSGTGYKIMGGASVKPLYYPPHATWGKVRRQPIVYIPNPEMHMTPEHLHLYRKLALGYEEPEGMDAVDADDNSRDLETSEFRNTMETNSFNVDTIGLSSIADDSAEYDNNENEDYTDQVAAAPPPAYEYASEDEALLQEAEISSSNPCEKATQEYNVVRASTSLQVPRRLPINTESRTNTQSHHCQSGSARFYPSRSGVQNGAGSSSSRRQELRERELHVPVESILQGDVTRTSASPESTYGSDPIYNISSEDEAEDVIPRRSLRLANMGRSSHIENQHAGPELDIRDEFLESFARRHEELLEFWLLASKEYNSLISKSAKVNSSAVVSNCAKNDGYSIIVDLGDLSKAFWDCFEAACLEDSESAIAIHADLELLATHRLQRMGLTKEMIEIRVPRILTHVSSLEAYSAHNVETFFAQAAMRNWQAWAELASILDVDVVDMKSVEESSDWLLEQFEEARNTLRKSAMKVENLIKLRDEYLQWKEDDAKSSRERNARSEEDFEILTAKKKESHALHQLTVYHISYSSLAKFRKYHDKARKIFQEVKQGGELTAMRNMCQGVLDDSVIFGDFSVTYTSVTTNYTLREIGTYDAGGLTDRFLTQAWSMLFNSSGEFHSVFEKGDSVNHLSTTDPDSNPQRQSDIMLVGQLMFLIALKEQRVTRETTMATLALAMGKVPDRDIIRTALEKNESNIYIEDYKRFWPNEFSLMSLLLAGGTQNAQETICMITASMTDDCLRFGKLTIDVGEEQFEIDVKKIMVDIIYDTLFVRCSRVGKFLREGFFSLINTVATSPSVGEKDKKEVLSQSFNGVEVSAMGAFFSAEQVVTAKEFLSRVDYEPGFPADLKSMFIAGVKEFTCPEACRLYAFVTDEKFNRGTRCNVKCNRMASPESLPRAATCTKTLELPRYSGLNQLVQKLSLAIYSTDYGHA